MGSKKIFTPPSGISQGISVSATNPHYEADPVSTFCVSGIVPRRFAARKPLPPGYFPKMRSALFAGFLSQTRNIFAPLRLCASPAAGLVAVIRISHYRLSEITGNPRLATDKKPITALLSDSRKV